MQNFYNLMVNNLQDGDILLEKSNTLLGNLVGNCIWKLGNTPLKWYLPHDPKKPSNHNAIFGHDISNNPVIFEMLANGLVETPIKDYVKLVETRTSELKFVRLNDITKNEQQLLIDWCIKNLNTGYDYFSYGMFLAKIFFHAKLNVQSKKRYYCTEMVKHAYQSIKNDFLLDVDFPVSLDIENKIGGKKLNIILELYN